MRCIFNKDGENEKKRDCCLPKNGICLVKQFLKSGAVVVNLKNRINQNYGAKILFMIQLDYNIVIVTEYKKTRREEINNLRNWRPKNLKTILLVCF